MTTSVAIAISGGIDSLYSAHLLINAGYTVTGIHFFTGYETHADVAVPSLTEKNSNIIHYCECHPSTTALMKTISHQLGIPIHIVDVSSFFTDTVVNDFVKNYQAGRTPNPCLVCNPTVKFGLLSDFAMSLGTEKLATGHYARIGQDDSGTFHLYTGIDARKDQSYFLAFLGQEQLSRALFPLGDKEKTVIQKEANKAGLSSATPGESQDICFIQQNDYKTFLMNQPEFTATPGNIKTLDGIIIGKHSGLHSFTVGQRRGINCPGPVPYYVIKLETNTNSLIVGTKKDLLSKTVTVNNINWINKPDSQETELTVKIRYNHAGSSARVRITTNNSANVNFHEPVTAVTPGQGAVFYSGSEVLGGGWIN